MKRLLITMAVLALGCVLGPEGAYAQATHQHKSGASSSAPGSMGRGERAGGKESRGERMFITRAARDGHFEVQFGQLAEQKSTNPQVKELGQMLVNDHTKANQQLQQIAQNKQVQLSTTPEEAMTKRMQRFESLSGNEFDRAYVEEVVKDHRRDIASFERQAKKGTDPDVKAYAQNTLPVLRQHLQRAEQILASLPKSGTPGGQPSGSSHQGGASSQHGGMQGQSGGTGMHSPK